MTSTQTPPSAPPAPATAPAGRARWERPSLVALLALTGVLYLWDLPASGWANDFYAAAAQAGTQSWKALFFGSLDAGNVITVDKPPAALWLMGLSGRLFGFSSFSMLLPQALCGIGSVWLLHSAVRRWSGPVAALLAGAALALTPVAVLMFKFNNPDALLVFLMVLGAYSTVRATEQASWRWLALAGVAVGFAFLAKTLQAFLVLPAFGLVYLLAAPAGLGKRVSHLLGAVVALVVSAGWFVVVVDLWPVSSRPYIGGSTDDTELDLALGYNGLGRVFGGQGNGGGMGGGNTGFGGATGLGRMFGASFGAEVSWLLPAALIALVAGLWFTRHAPRTDRTRAALLLWGGWTVVTALVFSYMQGTVHPYYVVALAPGIAGLVGIGAVELWKGRDNLAARVVLGLVVAVTAGWGFVLLDRTPEWLPWLRWTVALLGLGAATAIIMGVHRFARAATAVALAALLAGFGATSVYAVATAATAHSGSIPTSGPVSSQMGGGFGGGAGGQANAELVRALQETTGTWAAASNGSMGAGSLQLASGRPVIAIGGFNGGDPAPTLAEFQRYVADGQVRYHIPGGRGGGDSISSWVEATFTQVTIGGEEVYDLSLPLD
ncbi:ArnT family glycosyltransferase [Actinokineospora sp. G85]|uniref:ArnT family glycosyltransferase n=1 Tax=Actinokineospora sp. G85 TaxID=3406626 RepID=UPI003C729785